VDDVSCLVIKFHHTKLAIECDLLSSYQINNLLLAVFLGLFRIIQNQN